jgi:tetratricopeptide (TPR) repeat protein
LTAAAVMLALAAPVWCEEDRPVSDALGLSSEALSRFLDLQEGWLEWLGAAYQGDRERADGIVQRLLDDARSLGLERLPDLSLGAAGRAVGFAREGEFQVAAWSLEAAEGFDPDRPEVAFAAARVAELEGKFPTAVAKHIEAYARLLKQPLLRFLGRANGIHWLLFVVVATGGLYVAVLMSTLGVDLFQDVSALISRYVPGILALVVTAFLLSWPLLLPAGLLWLVIYWSILMWSYGSMSQRLILIGLWVVVGAAPILISRQRQQIRVDLAPSALSVESLTEGQLRGSLFGDLATLRAFLPESPAVTHLLADLHCRLGEWSSAKSLYEELLRQEPANGAALLNVGVCYFRLGDATTALEQFQLALSSEESEAASRFNMSQVYSELYRFRDAERELNSARRLAPEAVGEWLRRAETERVVLLGGGLDRAAEIRDQLVALWGSREAGVGREASWPRVLSLPLALAFILIAVGLHVLVRRGRSGSRAVAGRVAAAGTWRSLLLPGWAEAETGHPIQAFFSLFALIALISLPLASELGYRLPWIYARGSGAGVVLAAVGLVLFFVVRILRYRGGGL